ncbi:MAG: shikimate dehydrogenase [Candidatus Omnitrophica bacterium]|nr:shikimate dehydrogenase [Candidatus Omnitrophota bacterium]
MNQSKKALYGLVGFPIKHSFSPAMHNAAFAACNISAEYKLFEVESPELENFLLKRNDIAGFNITIPHKVKACQILEKNFPFNKNSKATLDDLYYVKLSGAVNTVKRKGEGADYYNTDARGFLRSLKEDLQFEPEAKTVLLIGCGGVGRAVLAALSWKNGGAEKIYIYDLNQKAIDSLQRHFLTLPQEWRAIADKKIEVISQDKIAEKIKESQLLVNATPLGMKEGDPSPIDKNMLHKDLFVYDVVYNRNTELISDAKARCSAVSGGLGMLLYQGVAAWELWTKKTAPVEVMRKTLNEEIKKKC